ncbi:hypothetical protein J6590_058165 [Homalodisca vitripennis]|nr:hypothetical protein J6590_058165 [Homalodisca vitripennis]
MQAWRCSCWMPVASGQTGDTEMEHNWKQGLFLHTVIYRNIWGVVLNVPYTFNFLGDFHFNILTVLYFETFLFGNLSVQPVNTIISNECRKRCVSLDMLYLSQHVCSNLILFQNVLMEEFKEGEETVSKLNQIQPRAINLLGPNIKKNFSTTMVTPNITLLQIDVWLDICFFTSYHSQINMFYMICSTYYKLLTCI